QVRLGRNIYGERVRADFVVHNLVEFPQGLVIESKRQDGSGTAYQKYPFVRDNIFKAQSYAPHPVVIVLFGGGRPGAVRWLRACVDGECLRAVFSFEELMSWLQRDVHVRVNSPTFDWTRRSSHA